MTDIPADQESTPRKKAGKKVKRKVVSKKEASPTTKKQKEERCCTCKTGRCYKKCSCRRNGSLCRNCETPNCQNCDTSNKQQSEDLDVKNSTEEKKKSYTPDGATPKQQTKKSKDADSKQSRSPLAAVIQSFEQADYYMRNLRAEVTSYRSQVNVLMDQVNSLSQEIRGFRSQQGKDREVLEKRRLEIEELSAELKKGRKEFEAFKCSLETKTLHREVKDALGEKSGYLGNILSDNTNASKQMGVELRE